MTSAAGGSPARPLDGAAQAAPIQLAAIEAETRELGFSMASERETGGLLRTLAASKPGGRFLELGTGTGLGTSWILDGMDRASTLVSVESDERVLGVARRHLGHDSRVTFRLGDGGRYLEEQQSEQAQFDLVFADAWPGKYTHLDVALSLVAIGGLYVVDDMLPQPSWPDGHEARAASLVLSLVARSDYLVSRLDWSTGLIVAVRRRPPSTSETG